MATIAVFSALGGTSYALSLPRNSVGASHLRSDSVGRSELRADAVRSGAIKDRSIRFDDIARAARRGLRGAAGPPGPPGPTFAAAVDPTGTIVRGNALVASPSEPNGLLVRFPRPVDTCVATATLAYIPSPVTQAPPVGHITVAAGPDGTVLVRTWDADGTAVRRPFHVIVAC